MLANLVFWRLMLFYTHVLLLLQPSVLWLSIATFNNDAKPPPKWILLEFDVFRIRPRLGGLLHLETFTWQNLTPAERVTRSGRPGYRLKWEIIWTGGLPHLSGLPHLPGVPHLHINRPLIGSDCRIPRPSHYMCRCALKNEVYNNRCYSYSMRCK